MKLLAALGLALACPLACTAATDAAPAPSASSASSPGAPSPARQFQALTGIDGAGWKLIQETPDKIMWMRPDQIIVALHVKPRGDGDAYMFDQVTAQDRVRTDIAPSHGGLVQVQVRHPTAATTYDLITFKMKLASLSPQYANSPANAYVMIAAFPLDTSVGDIQLLDREGPTTGQREAMVTVLRAMKGGDARISAMPPHDPYDARFDASALYVDSDARQWDNIVPTHPLSRVRALMPQLLARSKLPGVPESVEAELAAASAATPANAP